METEMIQLVGYTTGLLGCSILIVYYLREFLNKRLRASLWWAAGFFSYACALVTLAITVFDGFSGVLLLAFVFVSASVTFLYYAASLLLFDRGPFFTVKFAVIVFAVSSFLFLLPLYLSSEEYTAEITGSSVMALFAVAFFVIAVLFSQAARLHTDYPCRKLVTLHSLSWWIVATWSLYIALFWGLLVTCGLVFVLSSFEYILLLYGYKGGENMSDKDEESSKLYIQVVNGVEDKVLQEAGATKQRLNDIMQEIGDTLLVMRVKEEESHTKEDSTKEKMVTYDSQIGIKEDVQIGRVVKLVKANLELVRKVYSGAAEGNPQPYQIDEIPYAIMCKQSLETLQSAGDNTMKVLGTLARTSSSTDSDMILSCCNLVLNTCTLENKAVTEYLWRELEESVHPGGMIGYTYNILHNIDTKIGKTYAEDFKDAFLAEADRLFNNAKELREGALVLMSNLPKPPLTPTEQQAQEAATFLKYTVDLLKGASKLLFCASKFVNNPKGFGSSKDCIF